MSNILIVAPHPDDEVLGCGGIMARFIEEGNSVFVAIMTNGNIGAPELFPIEGTLRGRKEALDAHSLLGVTETFFFDFPAPRLETVAAYEISLELNKLIKHVKATDLFIPHRGDIHKDHKIIFETSLVAARPIESHKVMRIYAYETLSETEWAAPFPEDNFIPNYYCRLDEKHLNLKLDAFKCFTPPRLKEFPYSRSIDGVKTLARFRGCAISSPFAEAFSIVRMIS
jgi:LmbE family N-acetylglucosaminyl deacetylase